MSLLKLINNEIHLWFAFPQKINDTDLLNQYQQLLNPEEYQRWQRFHFPRHQHQYLITRALVRTTLSYYADIAPKDWQFSKNQYGKPAIKNFPQPLFFNLSNTESLIVCAVSQQPQMGVDVESVQHKTSSIEIAQRFFAPQEVEDLNSLSANKQKQRFFQYWTLKEAYIKAKGLGLSLPLEQFAFLVSEKNKSLELSFAPCLQEDATQWQAGLLQANENHYASVCILNPKHIHYTLQLKQAIPLQNPKKFSCPLLASTTNIKTT